MSAMVKSFAEELKLEIKPLSTILDIESTGGGRVPYHGYVECRLKLPQIEKFYLDVLMLVLDDSLYGMRVPVQIGSLHIDMAIDLATEVEMQKLSRKWELAKMAHLLCMGSMTMNDNSDKSEFNLDEIRGSVHLTQNLTLGLFENATISGLLKGPVKSSSYYKHVNVSVEPLEVHKEDGAKYCAVPGYTFLKPGSHRIHVMIKNMTARNITVNQGSKIAEMAAAIVIPHMLAPQVSMQTETLPAKNAQCSTVKGGEQCSNIREPPRGSPLEKEVDRTPLPPDKMEKLFEQIKLKEGTSHWTEDQQK